MTLLAVAVGAFVVDDNVVGVVAVLLLCWFIQVNGIGSFEQGKVVRYRCVGAALIWFSSERNWETRPKNSEKKARLWFCVHKTIALCRI